MKPVLLILAMTLPSSPSPASQVLPQPFVDTDAPQHGGGCRKSSPPGQCCHAGSQPLHCH